MSKLLVLRLITPKIFTRIEVSERGNIRDLKEEIFKITNIPISEQQLYYDIGYKQPIRNPDASKLSILGKKEGDQIFLKNVAPSKEPQKKESTILSKKGNETQQKCPHGENVFCVNCIDKRKKNIPEKPKTELEKEQIKNGLTDKCTHLPGQKCLHCMKTVEYKGELKYKCQHGEGGKCPNCVDKEFISDAKHKSFDQYINERKEKCKGTHEISTVCINCMPPSKVKYKMNPKCPYHPPYPQGSCNKCMPPNVILNRQIYRHVDYVSFMNKEEIEIFLKPWIETYFNTQRMAYLFGYYAKDPNYPNGVRAIVEALYQPPQIGDQSSVQPIKDKDIDLIEELTTALSLECIGWIFTSTQGNGVALSCYDVRKAARYQEEYQIDHSSGVRISRFITCVVKPNDSGECQIEVYMVSDMCQALERDNLFESNLKDNKKMQVRKGIKNEMLPTIYMENKPCEEFDPDFFIVNIAHGVPQDKKDMNILKSYDFPIQARAPKGVVTESMIKDYFKIHRKDPPIKKIAGLYVLLWIAKTIDKGAAVTYCKQIKEGFIDWEAVEILIGQYL